MGSWSLPTRAGRHMQKSPNKRACKTRRNARVGESKAPSAILVAGHGEVLVMPKRVAIYLRVSTTDQTVENQRRELRAIAERHGWQVVAELLRDKQGARRASIWMRVSPDT